MSTGDINSTYWYHSTKNMTDENSNFCMRAAEKIIFSGNAGFLWGEKKLRLTITENVQDKDSVDDKLGVPKGRVKEFERLETGI